MTTRYWISPGLLLAMLAMLAGCPHDLTRPKLGGDGGASEAGAGDLGDIGPRDQSVEPWLDACVPTNGGEEICDGLDNDCDGTPDDGFDLKSDLKNCGACGNACVTPNGTATCSLGKCAVSSCAKDSAGNSTHWDEDEDWKNGCEYKCAITKGGHEVCDGLDNDCDGDKDKDDACGSLLLLYRFGDTETQNKWPTVINLAGVHSYGLASSGTSAGKSVAGVPGDGSDNRGIDMDGTSGMVAAARSDHQQLFSCDSATGWLSTAGSVTPDIGTKQEGAASLKIPAATNHLKYLANYKGSAKNLSKWKIAGNKLQGFLTFWVFVKDATHSKLETVTMGNGVGTKNASWKNVEASVLAPTAKTFVNGWNLVALPFAGATYTGLSLIDWTDVVYLVFYTNLFNAPAGGNYFLLDDISVEKDLSQRFTRFTMMAWVRPTAAKSGAQLLHKKISLPAMGIDVSGTHWWFTLGGGVEISSTAVIKAGAWTHLAMTFDGTTFTAYQDGVKLGSKTGGFTPGTKLSLGGDGLAGHYFNGVMDEVAIYSRAMGAKELLRYYSLFKP